MSKRPCPFEDHFQRQLKTQVHEQHLTGDHHATYMQTVFERTNALLFEGAKRAANEPAVMPGAGANAWDRLPDLLHPGESTDDEDINMETYESHEMPRSRVDRLRNAEKRDPSPIPTSRNLITNFITSTCRTHGPFSEVFKNNSMNQAQALRQLNIDSFMSPVEEGSNLNLSGPDKDTKDENHNMEMDF